MTGHSLIMITIARAAYDACAMARMIAKIAAGDVIVAARGLGPQRAIGSSKGASTVIKPLSSLLLIATLGLTNACAGDDPPAQTGTDSIDSPAGFGFVHHVVITSDLCPANGAHSCQLGQYPPPAGTHVTLSQPDTGKLCLKGNVGDGGYALLVLGFTNYATGTGPNEVVVKSTLNADKLGITQVSFSLDGTLPGATVLEASIVTQYSCTGPTGQGCRTGGFELTDDAGDVISLDQAGPLVAPLASFVQQYPEQATKNFDTSALDGLELELDAGDFDFCLSDFKLLDADGIEVTP
jgi:hypothetical protein